MVQSFVSDNYDFDTRMKIVRSEDGMDRAIWQQFAELGLLAAPFSEEMGGLDGGPVETMVLWKTGSRSGCRALFADHRAVGGILNRHGSAAQKEGHLPGIIAGENIWALAFNDRRAGLTSPIL